MTICATEVNKYKHCVKLKYEWEWLNVIASNIGVNNTSCLQTTDKETYEPPGDI